MQESRLLILWTLLWGVFMAVSAQSTDIINKAEAGRHGDSAVVYMTLLPENMQVASNEILSITPRLVGETDSVELPTVRMLGRMPYYRFIRHDSLGIIMPTDFVIWEKQRYRPFAYQQAVDWQQWMDRASLKVQVERMDCRAYSTLTGIDKPLSETIVRRYLQTIQPKPGSVTSSVTVVFPLNRTEIHPELSNNRSELDKIRQGIVDVRSDKNNVLQQVTIKGYASPDGPYDNNVRLARGRTDSIAAYVANHFDVDSSQVKTDYEPEDWDGLIAYLKKASVLDLPHRDEMLEVALDNDLDPDQRERKMRTSWPKDFDFLLKYCLPRLRHTDYRIDYLYYPPATTTTARIDTLWHMRKAVLHEHVDHPLSPYQALFALKTNVLFDLVMGFNGEIEVPLGDRWSVMGEIWKPWFVWHHNSRAYQLQIIGGEIRYWLGRCRQQRPRLTGWFVGPYYAWGKYDFEWGSTGDQGEFHSIGVTAGYSWPIHRHWNLEVSASIGTLGGGWLGGERRYYNGMFDDTHLIWQYTTNSSYTGPTKLKVSLSWLIGKKRKEVRP